jgi:hypothetical protein
MIAGKPADLKHFVAEVRPQTAVAITYILVGIIDATLERHGRILKVGSY